MSKTIIVSGGAKGIGRCIVRRFLENGYRAWILDIDEEELEHTTKVHLKQWYDANAVGSAICNLRDADEIKKKVAEGVEFLGGRVGVLVNNGGIATPQWTKGQDMGDVATMDEWQAYVDTNLTAPFAVSQACIPHMRIDELGALGKIEHDSDSDAGPCIIHIGSFRAHQSDPHQEGYASTKAGLLGLMHSMAVSLQPMGIRVNLVAPGRIKVAHECKAGDEKNTSWVELNEEKDVQDHPTNRAGRPMDVAGAVEYLVHAGFVTAQDITVDGGATKVKS